MLATQAASTAPFTLVERISRIYSIGFVSGKMFAVIHLAMMAYLQFLEYVFLPFHPKTVYEYTIGSCSVLKTSISLAHISRTATL
jgi:hypothetical protein